MAAHNTEQRPDPVLNQQNNNRTLTVPLRFRGRRRAATMLGTSNQEGAAASAAPA